MIIIQQDDLKTVANFFNADHIAITNLEKNNAIHSYSKAWHEEYISENLWEEDPVHQKSLNTDEFFWDNCGYYYTRCTRLAHRFGIKSGLTLKLFSPNENEYLITLASSKNKDIFMKNLNLDHLYALSSIAMVLDLIKFKKNGHLNFLKHLDHYLKSSSLMRENMHEVFEILESMQTEIDFLIPFRFKDNLEMFNKNALEKTKTPLSSDCMELSNRERVFLT